jgi:hypothetical protein
MSGRRAYDADIQTSGGIEMKVNSFILNITSEQPERLTSFFRDTVQLEPHPAIQEAFSVGDGAAFIIDGHSETIGPAKEPHRALINFWFETTRRTSSRSASGLRRPA